MHSAANKIAELLWHYVPLHAQFLLQSQDKDHIMAY